MHTLNAIHVQDMVKVIRLEMEQEQARRELMAIPRKPSIIARSRRSVGASFIASGKLIQGRSQAKRVGDSGRSSLEPAH
jgi:hypothetical protein